MSEQQAEQAAPEKPADECAFPDCHRTRVPKDPTVRGARPRYCDDPEHNAASAWKAKHRGPSAGPSAQAVEEDLDRPVSGAAKTRLHVGESVLDAVKTLGAELPRYLQLMEQMNDPEAVEAEVASAAARADHEIAEAQKELVDERDRRKSAERRAKTAEEAKAEADEATEEAFRQLEEAKEKFRAEVERIREEAAAAVAAAEEERDEQVAQAQADAEQKVSEVEERTAQEVADAEEKAGKATVEADRRVK
ncbi:hypothetical protein ABZ829_36620, partial [Streptomyces xanthochromogenes]|uniref:hypothetical protein n=1 Tax=Streptomyces xanthochromogenes TaxID=67384 RepID=UPI00343D3379